MIYLYALCPNLLDPPQFPAGIGSKAVELLTVDQVGAIIERDIDVAQLKTDDARLMDAVLAHDRVLGYCFDQMPLLPLRFGTQFKDVASIQAFLQAQGQVYAHKLETLKAKAEYLLKLSPKLPEIPPVSTELKGRDYFLAKKARLQAQTAAAEQQAAELQEFLASLEAAGIPLVQSPPQGTEERLHILLTREREATQSLVEQWQEKLSTWQLEHSDPLPPYHFAS